MTGTIGFMKCARYWVRTHSHGEHIPGWCPTRDSEKDTASGTNSLARRETYHAVPGPLRPCEDLFLTITNYNAWNSPKVFFLLYYKVIICIIVYLAFVQG